MVFTPAAPRLYMLNLNSWLIFELSRSHSGQALAAAYRSAVGHLSSDAEAEEALEAGLRQLEQAGIIERIPQDSSDRIDGSGLQND